MGLLNNNNYRKSKRTSLRKQKPVYDANDPYGTGFNSSSGDSFSTNFSTSGTGGGFIDTNQQSSASSKFNSGGNMMGYMQLAAAATPMVMGFIQGRKQKKLAGDLETERLAKDKEIAGLLANRQQVRNPYANLAVATEAAEFQAQQVDQSLANTLDAMQAGGFGAGGATALAREAAKSKQCISADIQKQEATNQKFFAQGEQIRQNMQEQRSIDDIDFARAQSDNLRQMEMNALNSKQAAQQAGVGGSMQMAQSIMSNPDMVKSISGIFGG